MDQFANGKQTHAQLAAKQGRSIRNFREAQTQVQCGVLKVQRPQKISKGPIMAPSMIFLLVIGNILDKLTHSIACFRLIQLVKI